MKKNFSAIKEILPLRIFVVILNRALSLFDGSRLCPRFTIREDEANHPIVKGCIKQYFHFLQRIQFVMVTSQSQRPDTAC